MKAKILILIVAITAITVGFISCHKEDTTRRNEMGNLVMDFKLRPLDLNKLPNGVVIQKFNSISEARVYLQNLSTEFSKTKRRFGKVQILPNLFGGSYKTNQLNGSIYSLTLPIMTNCSPCGGGFVNATTDFGLASNMHLAFNFESGASGYNISNLNTYTTGVTPLGWN